MSNLVPRFVIASEGTGQTWLDKASRGEPVTAVERNAFAWQASAVMDALANPSQFLGASGPVVPREVYNGPVREWSGREVPLVGTGIPPSQWFEKRARSAGGVGGPGKTWADVLLPTDTERRDLYLAMGRVMKSLHGEGEVISRRTVEAPRTAGVIPLVPVVVVAVVGLAILGVVLVERYQEVVLRETEETARQAAELAAAQRAWLERVQWAAQHPGQPMPPPSPAEVRVLTRPQPQTPSPAESSGDAWLKQLEDGAKRVALVGALGLGLAVAGPPILANVADRATRAPSGGGRA